MEKLLLVLLVLLCGLLGCDALPAGFGSLRGTVMEVRALRPGEPIPKPTVYRDPLLDNYGHVFGVQGQWVPGTPQNPYGGIGHGGFNNLPISYTHPNGLYGDCGFPGCNLIPGYGKTPAK